MATTLFLIFAIATLWHFIYESILLPSFRMSMRFKLFKLRDELRQITLENPSKISQELFHEMDELICISIKILPRINFRLIKIAHSIIDSRPELIEQIAKRKAKVNECEIQRLRQISEECSETVIDAAMVNQGALFPYLIPALVVVIFWETAKITAKSIVFTPTAKVDSLLPDEIAIAY
jgi:hypothetical protein